MSNIDARRSGGRGDAPHTGPAPATAASSRTALAAEHRQADMTIVICSFERMRTRRNHSPHQLPYILNGSRASTPPFGYVVLGAPRAARFLIHLHKIIQPNLGNLALLLELIVCPCPVDIARLHHPGKHNHNTPPLATVTVDVHGTLLGQLLLDVCDTERVSGVSGEGMRCRRVCVSE
jgi:hypothetical protein